MTNQEVFDRAYRHMLRQGYRGDSYRGDDGTRCVVGVFIPDALYRPEIEGQSAGVAASVGMLPGFDLEHLRLLNHLQVVHDTIPESVWPEVLAQVAAFFRLAVPAANELALSAPAVEVPSCVA